MAKVFIEETTLTAIGDAIRGKEGTTELVPVTDMATRITDLPSGGNEPTDEELVVTGESSNRFSQNGWNWFIDKYGDRITTKDITGCLSMFAYSSKLEEVPFQINIKNCYSFAYMFASCTNMRSYPNIRGTITWNTNTSFDSFGNSIYARSIDNMVTPEMLEGFSTVKITGQYTCPKLMKLTGFSSLRKVPEWWYKFRLSPESTAYPALSYCLYNNMVQNCYTLDEITNIPVWKCQAAQTSNMFSNTFGASYRLKDVTFETNEDGSAIVTEWKSQTIDLTQVGWCSASYKSQILNYNSGITEDKAVTDAASYEALKNDPDWFCLNTTQYSRYNHDSAVNTINSLPDTSAYLATAGGTNTIKFKGDFGSHTDGGAINTLTEEEIAVATAKGWTVTLV